MWLDDCRIPFVDTEDIDFTSLEKNNKNGNIYGNGKGFHIKHERLQYTNKGRFTPNLLVCDDMLNDGSITKQGNIKLHKISGWGENQQIEKNAVEFRGDKGTNSRYYDLDKWFDKIIDEL